MFPIKCKGSLAIKFQLNGECFFYKNLCNYVDINIWPCYTIPCR